MKVLVIGASSFTGKHFCEYAREHGAEVIEGNWRVISFTYSMLESVDYVVNFAALNVVAPSWQQPYSYMKVNCLDQIWIWDHLRKSENLEKYIHVSTPEVYGSQPGYISELSRLNPSTPYAVSRAAAEMMLRCYHQQYELPVVFTRACNVYGPGQQLYRLIPKVIASIKKGIKFPLEGNGTSFRSFLHVRDVCRATWKLMLDGVPGEAYNISTPLETSISDIIKMICERLGKPFEDFIEHKAARLGQDMKYRLKSTKIRDLGWTDTISIETGIDSVIDHINTNWETLKDEPMEYVFKP